MMLAGLVIQDLTGVTITSTGSVFPSPGKFILNTDIHELVYGKNWEQKFQQKNYDPDFIRNKLGFEKRYWTHVPGNSVNHSELTSGDLMELASIEVLKKSRISNSAIDVFIAVTVTSPRYTNSMGTFVAGKLGLTCPAFEIKTGCASSVYALVMAAQFIKSGARNVLIACGETPSKVTGKDSNLIYAVGDGGAAVLLSKTEDKSKGIITAFLGSEGKYSGTMGTPGLLPPNQTDLENNAYNMLMGKESEEFIHNAWQSIPKILYQNSGMNSNNIDLLIPHQVNKNMINLVAEAAEINNNKVINLISQYGNCGSASILIALHNALQTNKINKDSFIMLAAVGGGVSFGGLILKM